MNEYIDDEAGGNYINVLVTSDVSVNENIELPIYIYAVSDDGKLPSDNNISNIGIGFAIPINLVKEYLKDNYSM